MVELLIDALNKIYACQRNKPFIRNLEHNNFHEKEKELSLSPKEVGKVPFKRNQKIARGFLHVFYNGKLLKKECSYMSPFS